MTHNERHNVHKVLPIATLGAIENGMREAVVRKREGKITSKTVRNILSFSDRMLMKNVAIPTDFGRTGTTIVRMTKLYLFEVRRFL